MLSVLDTERQFDIPVYTGLRVACVASQLPVLLGEDSNIFYAGAWKLTTASQSGIGYKQI